jgi:hypothetical protein
VHNLGMSSALGHFILRHEKADDMKGIVQTTFIAAAFFLPFNLMAQELQNFEIVGRYFYGDSAFGPVIGVCIDGGYIYLAANFDSIRVFAVDMEGLPTQEVGGSSPEWNVENLHKFDNLLVGVTPVWGSGYDIFDVSLPDSIRHLCHVNEGSETISHPEISGGYLYTPVGNYFEGVGMKCYDISDPSNPVLTDWIFPRERGPGFDLAINGTVGYLTFIDARMTVINLENPYDMFEISPLDNYGGPVELHGRNLFVGPDIYGDSTLMIFDVNDPAQPNELPSVLINIHKLFSMRIRNDGFLLIHGDNWLIDGTQGISIWDIGGFEYPELLASFKYPWYSTNTFLQFDAKDNFIYYAAGDSGLYVLRYTGPMPINTGDANNSGAVNGIDVVYMVNYFRSPEPPPLPDPPERGDANGDCVVNGLDVVYLVNYLKGYGEKPIRAFCYGR